VYSSATTIQPGSWISIYGSGFAASNVTWNGDFPQTLGGASVTINGKPAYLWYISPGQINLQAPDDTPAGIVPVVVTTPYGTSSATVTLAPVAPSLSLLSGHYAAGIILRSDGTGSYGGGAYDILGPTGRSFGYPTVAARSGDAVELFGVGFGPTAPAAKAGQVLIGAATATDPVGVQINGVSVTPFYAGMTEAGLYQINVTIPAGLGTGDVPVVLTVGGSTTALDNLISLQ
jgi:uncharacterized protein (TIGR03437 family)